MGKESGEQTSKTLFSAAALVSLFHFIYFSNPVKIPKIAKLGEKRNLLFIILFFYERPHFRARLFKRRLTLTSG